jgi:hypothetical protein
MAIGLVLIALGGLFLADRVFWLPVDAFSRYWPVILILLGSGHFFSRERRGGMPWLLVVGVIMLLHTTDVLRLNDSWPLFIVAAGLGSIWRGWNGGGRNRRSEVAGGDREGDDVR